MPVVGVWARAAVVGTLATATLATGCGVSGREIVDESRARGGGLTGDLVVDAVGAVAERQGVDTVALRSVTVVFTQVVLEVGVPAGGAGDAPSAPDGIEALADVDEVVVYEYGTSGRFGEHGLAGPRSMVGSSIEAPLGPALFTLEQAGVERFDEMVATALEEADLAGAYATGATIARAPGGGGPRTVVTVTGDVDGDAVDVTFAPDGRVVGEGE